MPLKLPLHHIGVATRGIEKELPFFEAVGYAPVSPLFTDPARRIRGRFVAAPGQPTLELLENIDDSGPLDSCLKNGVKFYHLAYASTDIEADCATLATQHRAKVIVPLTPAVYFARVCFLILPNMLMIELVETHT